MRQQCIRARLSDQIDFFFRQMKTGRHLVKPCGARRIHLCEGNLHDIKTDIAAAPIPEQMLAELRALGLL